MQLQVFYHNHGHRAYKRVTGRERPPERGSKDPKAPRGHPCRRALPTAPAFPGQSRQGTVGATADG